MKCSTVNNWNPTKKACSFHKFFIETAEDDKEWTETIDFGSATVKFKLDTGTSANVLPYKTFRAIRQDRGHTSNLP